MSRHVQHEIRIGQNKSKILISSISLQMIKLLWFKDKSEQVCRACLQKQSFFIYLFFASQKQHGLSLKYGKAQHCLSFHRELKSCFMSQMLISAHRQHCPHFHQAAPAESVSTGFDAWRPVTLGYLHRTGFSLQDTRASEREGGLMLF